MSNKEQTPLKRRAKGTRFYKLHVSTLKQTETHVKKRIKNIMETSLSSSPPLTGGFRLCPHRAIYSLSDANNVNTRVNYRISEHSQHTQLPTKVLKIGADYRRKQRQENTYWLAWSLGPRDRMNVWHRHNGRGTTPLVQVLVCFSLFRSLSFVPRMDRVCVPGRISIRGVRRWRWWLKRGRSGGVDGGSKPQ